MFSGRPNESQGFYPIVRWFWILVPALVLTLWPSTAHAYAWMIRHGFAKCASCHVDPSGGETLTNFGRVMSDTTLSTRYDGDTSPRNAALLFYGVPEPEWLRLGGSLRVMNLFRLPKDGSELEHRVFPMQIDTYGQLRFDRFRIGGSLGISSVGEGSQHARPAQITSGNGDRDINLISRNHWLGYDVTDQVLVRAGRINLPFGIRVPEHVLWARDASRTDRESDQQHGAAISYSKGRWRGEVMGIAGNFQISPDEFRERGYALQFEYLLSTRLALGLGSLVTRAQNDRIYRTGEGHTRQAHGLTARYAPVRPLVILAEVDVLTDTVNDLGYVGMLQADVEPIGGLHLQATGEILDVGGPDGAPSAPGAGEPKLGGWFGVNWFFMTHWDFRLDAVFRQEEPIAIQSQIHFYF